MRVFLKSIRLLNKEKDKRFTHPIYVTTSHVPKNIRRLCVCIRSPSPLHFIKKIQKCEALLDELNAVQKRKCDDLGRRPRERSAFCRMICWPRECEDSRRGDGRPPWMEEAGQSSIDSSVASHRLCRGWPYVHTMDHGTQESRGYTQGQHCAET